MAAKGVVKDVARVLGIPFEDSNHITKLIPEQLKISLKEAVEQEPRLAELIDSNPKVKHLFDIAYKLEGLTRHASKHAAGIVITPEPIDQILPIYIPPKTNDIVTQYAMTELESIGFLKIDFLGLKNLTLIDRAVKLIKKNHGVHIDMDRLPLEDEKTFQLLKNGETSGVFQLESSGLKDVLRKLQPEKFEDIIAVNALYRPGPLGSGMVDDFIERKHGKQKITYLFEDLAPILSETYGVIVYQEQVMKIASTIAGYSLGESDILRRAMGKKKAEVMAEQRQIFLTKAGERKYDPKKAGQLFDLMEYFAGYGFNKSHSAAYALIAYQTAFLKANYPAEFMACLISLEATHAEKMSFYLQEAKDMGIGIKPPDVNLSQQEFSVVNGAILFGLLGIKNVGNAALDNIVNVRAKKPFTDLLDFCSRCDLRTVNKRVIENLICAGAFDTLPGNRAQQYDELSIILEHAMERKRQLETGQMGLFSMSTPDEHNETPAYEFTPRSPWNNKEKLDKEKEVIGFYLSAHPLDSYKRHLKRLSIPSFSTTLKKHEQTTSDEPMVLGCGLVKSSKVIVTKKGDRMAFVQLEDTESHAEIIVFPKVFAKIEEWLEQYHVFIIKGFLDITSTHQCKIKANVMVPVELFYQEWPDITHAAFHLPAALESKLIATLKQDLEKGSTPLHLIFHENGKKLRLKTGKKIKIDPDQLHDLEDTHGMDVTLEI